MSIYAHHLALILPLVRRVLTPLDLHVQILVLGSRWTFCWSEWSSGSVV